MWALHALWAFAGLLTLSVLAGTWLERRGR